jgi:glycosyltransferase involved in cell wall biosynthesis
MKKVYFVLKMPHDSYVGGIATIINSYIESSDSFYSQGYYPILYDYHNEKIDRIPCKKISNILYGILQAKYLLKTINENNDNNSDTIIHIHTSCRALFIKDVILARKIKKRTKCKVILSIHVGKLSTIYENIPTLLKTFTINTINKYIDKVLMLSNALVNEFLISGVNIDKCKVLYNFFNLTPINNINNKHSYLELIYIGAIKKEKGIIELLEAFSYFVGDSIHLHICGEITDNSIVEKIDEYKRIIGKQLTFHNYVKGQEKTRLLNECDILILPSYHEGFPLVVLEGMACKCAIVSTRVGSTPEVFTSENVFWIDIKDSQSIVNAIKYFSKNLEELQEMKEKNYIKSKEFEKQTHIKQLCHIYNDINLIQ